MNQSNLRGRLVNDPEIRTFPAKDGGTGTVAAFTLAVPDKNARRDENGNYPADFIRCSCFGKNADVVESFCMKGTELLVAGKLTSSSYEKDGVTVFSTEVSVQTFEFISGTKSKEKEPDNKEKGNKSK